MIGSAIFNKKSWLFSRNLFFLFEFEEIMFLIHVSFSLRSLFHPHAKSAKDDDFNDEENDPGGPGRGITIILLCVVGALLLLLLSLGAPCVERIRELLEAGTNGAEVLLERRDGSADVGALGFCGTLGELNLGLQFGDGLRKLLGLHGIGTALRSRKGSDGVLNGHDTLGHAVSG